MRAGSWRERRERRRQGREEEKKGRGCFCARRDQASERWCAQSYRAGDRKCCPVSGIDRL